MPKMVKFRATEKGYYGDVIHEPDGKHEFFDAPADFDCSWAERVDGKAPEPKPVVSEETLAAEAVLDAESDVAKSADLTVDDTADVDPDDSDNIPVDTDDQDVNKATGVEVL